MLYNIAFINSNYNGCSYFINVPSQYSLKDLSLIVLVIPRNDSKTQASCNRRFIIITFQTGISGILTVKLFQPELVLNVLIIAWRWSAFLPLFSLKFGSLAFPWAMLWGNTVSYLLVGKDQEWQEAAGSLWSLKPGSSQFAFEVLLLPLSLPRGGIKMMGQSKGFADQ